MKKFLPTLAAAAVLAAGTLVYAQDQSTETPPQAARGSGPGPQITFPIPELGNCGSKQECKTYCDEPGNAEACINFAESKGMMKADEAAQARKFSKQTGPGGCMGSKCREYCASSDHFVECKKFAEEHGLAPKVRDLRPKEPRLDEDKAEEVLAEKGGPGGCTTKDACKAYCSDASHMDECLKFAEDNGLMQKDDVELARRMMSETGPGECRGIACKDYCEDESHASECLDFAEKNGLMDKEDAAKARTIMEKGGPGGCKGRACERYCSDPAHREECFSFAKDNGLISPEDADRMQEMMRGEDFRGPDEREDRPGFFGGEDEQGPTSRGPGGCSSREECDAYCVRNPQECRPAEGMMPPDAEEREVSGDRSRIPRLSPEDIERMKQLMQKNGPQMMHELQQQMERGGGMPMQDFDGNRERFGPSSGERPDMMPAGTDMPPQGGFDGGQFGPPPLQGGDAPPDREGDTAPLPPTTSTFQNDRFTASVFSIFLRLLRQ